MLPCSRVERTKLRPGAPSQTKIITILGLILLGIIITAGGAGSPAIGFRYWKNPGPFQQENGIPGAKGEPIFRRR